MLTGAHKTQRMASALTVLDRYQKDGYEFLNHIVTSDETWVSFANIETKEQSKQWMHTHSPNKSKKFKQTSARTGNECRGWNSCNKGPQFSRPIRWLIHRITLEP
jgi:hypothetical protein